MEGRSKFSFSSLARCRWNILDLVRVVGRKAIPTYIFTDVDATWVKSVLSGYERIGQKVSLNAVLLKAIAIAQRAHPSSRSTLLSDGTIAELKEIVAGFTVDRFVGASPAVFFGMVDAPDTKPLEQITAEIETYAEDESAAVQRLAEQEQFAKLPWLFRQILLWFGVNDLSTRLKYMNATFSVSSIGKFGCQLIVPPSMATSTFGVGALEDRAVVRDGEIQIRPIFTLSLNFDHYMLDGAPAARFLNDVCSLLEGGLASYLPVDELGVVLEASR